MEGNAHYQALRSMMPAHRTPWSELLQDTRFRNELNALTRELAGDLRIRVKIEGYCDGKGIEKSERAEIRRTAESVIRTLAKEKLEQDAGYQRDAEIETAVSGLLSLFRLLSSHKNQMVNQRDLRAEHYRNLSEIAKRDLRKQKEQQGSWDLET